MTHPWSAIWLDAFRALQAIVAERASDDAALALRSWSAADRYGLRYRDNGETIRSAFAEAERDLQAWCRQGLVAARGRRIIGHYGERSEHEDLAEWWSTTRYLDFERSALRGSPAFLDVELRKADVVKLALPVQARARPENEAIPNPATRITSSTAFKTEGVLKACRALWPNPDDLDGLPPKDRRAAVRGWWAQPANTGPTTMNDKRMDEAIRKYQRKT